MSHKAVAAAAVVCLAFACNSDDTPTTPKSDIPGGTSGPDTIPPAAITGLLVTSPAARSLALQWVAPGDDGTTGTAHAYDLRFADTTITAATWDMASRYDNVGTPRPGGRVEQERVLDLSSNTTYYFALRTVDEAGNWSDISNCPWGKTTNEYTPPAAVTDLSAVAVASGTFLLTWTATGDDGYFGRAAAYDIRYSPNTRVINWGTAGEVNDEPVPRAVGEAESLLVGGLPTYNFVFAMRTGDEVPNWSADSNNALALAWEDDLWRFPATVARGKLLTILFRAPPSGNVMLSLGSCTTGTIIFEATGDPGVHQITYDFKSPTTGQYLPASQYTLSLCWDGEPRLTKFVELVE